MFPQPYWQPYTRNIRESFKWRKQHGQKESKRLEGDSGANSIWWIRHSNNHQWHQTSKVSIVKSRNTYFYLQGDWWLFNSNFILFDRLKEHQPLTYEEHSRVQKNDLLDRPYKCRELLRVLTYVTIAIAETVAWIKLFNSDYWYET